MGQGIVECVQCNSKKWVLKTKKGGELYPPRSPKAHISFVLLVLNLLQTDVKGHLTVDCH